MILLFWIHLLRLIILLSQNKLVFVGWKLSLLENFILLSKSTFICAKLNSILCNKGDVSLYVVKVDLKCRFSSSYVCNGYHCSTGGIAESFALHWKQPHKVIIFKNTTQKNNTIKKKKSLVFTVQVYKWLLYDYKLERRTLVSLHRPEKYPYSCMYDIKNNNYYRYNILLYSQIE